MVKSGLYPLLYRGFRIFAPPPAIVHACAVDAAAAHKPSPKPPPSRSLAAKPFEHAIYEILDETRIDAAPVSTPDGLQDASLGGGRRALSGKAFAGRCRSRDEGYRAKDGKLRRVSFPPASDFAQSAPGEMLDVDGVPVRSTSVNVVVVVLDLVEDGPRRRARSCASARSGDIGKRCGIVFLARTCRSAYGAAQLSIDAPGDHEYSEARTTQRAEDLC
jgi:hypothetical protein